MSRKKAEAAQEAELSIVEQASAVTGEPAGGGTGEKAEQDGAPAPQREAATNHQPRQPGDEPQYPQEPNPFQRSHSNTAGVIFFTRREPYQAELVFKEKPSQAVIDYLKTNGFRWDRQGKMWTRPINYDTQSQDRLVASRTYHKAVEMILAEKGLVAEPEKTPF